MFSPFVNEILQRLEEKLSALPTISKIFLPSALRINFYHDLQHYWAPKLLRAGTAELHNLRNNNKLKAATSKSRFEFFINLLSHPENSREFLQKYIVLKHQFLIYQEQYINTLARLLLRLEKNWEELIINHFKIKNPINLTLDCIKRSGDLHAGTCVSI